MWLCARIVTPRADGLRPARVAPMLRRHSGPALHVVALPRDRAPACRCDSPAMGASGSGSASSPFSLHKVGAASCRARCLSPTPTRLRHPAYAGPPPRRRCAHGWGRRRVSASGPVRPCAARRPCPSPALRPFPACLGASLSPRQIMATRRADRARLRLRAFVTPGGDGQPMGRASPVACGRRWCGRRGHRPRSERRPHRPPSAAGFMWETRCS